ncbi:MAG: hypothetical protein R2705_14320 [Ilumatobacteraceae bacterium]
MPKAPPRSSTSPWVKYALINRRRSSEKSASREIEVAETFRHQFEVPVEDARPDHGADVRIGRSLGRAIATSDSSAVDDAPRKHHPHPRGAIGIDLLMAGTAW